MAVTTAGAGSIGLYASRGGVLNASGTTTVTTLGGVSAATGLGAYGVNADGAGSAVNLAAATVKTSGAGAYGLLASDAANSGAAGSITATGPLNVQTTNPAATAVGLQGPGASILATGGGTIAAAGGAIAFLGGTNQIATFDDFTIASQGGDLIFADPSVATVNFNGVTANAGTNNLLDAAGGSFVTLNAAASTLTGAIKTDAASTSTVNLTNGSTWMMTGSSVVSNLAVSASYVMFAPPAAGGGFKTLTLGNYVGSGGFVTVNAVLGGTGAGSDEIVINGGKAMGSTLLTIRNIGSGGAQTTGAGIPVIVAVNGGTIAPTRSPSQTRRSPAATATRSKRPGGTFISSPPRPRRRPRSPARSPASRGRSNSRSSPAACSARSFWARPSRSTARIAALASGRSDPTRSARTAAPA